MGGDEWERIEELFERALPLATREREALLAGACHGDLALRAELDEMLRAASPEQALPIERLAAQDPCDGLVGTQLGHWRVVRVLGRGGMGTVYLAERADGHYRQKAALKVVSPGAVGTLAAERFRNERQVLAQLTHPNIARLLDGGFAVDGRPYFVMELVDGAPITEWCDARGSSLADRLRLFRVVCRTVQHAHGALVVHRDLKPANTFVSSDGEVKLLDFGIAKLLAPEDFGIDALQTREGATALTPEYAAPEQLFGGAITTATDVYSLGVLLYELVTGVRPRALAGKTPLEMERALASEAICPPSRRCAAPRGDDLDAIVLTALQVQPERRYASAGQFGDEIARFLEGRPVLAKIDSVAYRARRFVGRNRAAVAAAALFAVALAGFGVVAAWQARQAAAERDLARGERDKAEQLVGLLVEVFESSNPNLRPEGDRLSVRQLLSDAEPLVLDRLETQPAVRARLQQVFGVIYAARDQYPEARRALEQALADQRRLLGADHPDTIESLYRLGVLMEDLGDHERARGHLEEALTLNEGSAGAGNATTARILVALATMDRRDAGALLERALAIRRRVLRPDHPELADGLARLARYHDLRDDNEAARGLYIEALAVFAPAAGRGHPVAVEVMSNYAALLVDMGDYAGAERLLRESLAAAKRTFGPVGLAVADGLNELAVALFSHGRHAEGLRLFRDSYDRHVARLGEDHWRTINVARNIAACLALRQQHAEALQWIDRAIATLPRLPDPQPTMALSMAGRRAAILVRLGRGDEALRAMEAAIATLDGLSRADTGQVRTDLAMFHAAVLLETGRPAAAEAPARAALAAQEHLGEGHPSRARAECLLGLALVESGRRAAGREALARCLPRYRGWGLADPEAVAAMDRALAASE